MGETVDASYLGFIMRYTRSFFNPMSSRNALVRSKLEYNALAWNPLEKCYVKKSFFDPSLRKSVGTTTPCSLLDSYWACYVIIPYYFVFQLMRDAISWPTLLDRTGPNVQINFLRGRHHQYLGRLHFPGRSVI
jgi:hypothetical protein